MNYGTSSESERYKGNPERALPREQDPQLTEHAVFVQLSFGSEASQSIRSLANDLLELLARGGERQVCAFLSNFSSLAEQLPAGAVKQIVNYRRSEQSPTPLHTVVNKGWSLDTVSEFLKLGADVDLKAKFDFKNIHSKNSSVLHAAAYLRRYDLIEELAANSKGVDARNDLGDTPLLSLYHTSAKGIRFDCVFALVKLGADINASNAHNESCLSQCLMSGLFINAAWLSSLGAKNHETQSRFKLVAGSAAKEAVPEDVLLGSLGRLTARFPSVVRQEMGNLFAIGRDVSDLYLYASAFDDAARRGKAGTGIPLNALAPKLVFTYPASALTQLFTHVDGLMDHDPNMRGQHPNEAEMMLLLGHPEDRAGKGQQMQPLIYSLSGISRFVDKDVSHVSGATRWNWARIGAETFFSRSFKYDAMRFPDREYPGQERSLLERFGGERIEDRGKGFPLGPGYAFLPGTIEFGYTFITHKGALEQRTFDSDTYIETSRGGIKASHPVYGTLVIRNSNPDFGRDIMLHPAYWSPWGLGNSFELYEVMEHWDLDNDPQFYHVLNVSMYKMYKDAEVHLDFLIEQIRAWRSCYRAFKFDTGFDSAWEDFIGNGVRELVGGPFSQGFSAVVDLAQHLYDKNRAPGRRRGGAGAVQDLAFVNPEYPAWASYPFSMPDGSERRRLGISPDTIQVMRRHGEGSVTQEEIERTGIKSFFEVGFKNEAELVILDPIKEG